MRVLFDQGVPAAEAAGLEVLVTTDQNLRYQQDLAKRRIAVLVLTTTSWPRIQRRMDTVVAAIDALDKGDCREISFPR